MVLAQAWTGTSRVQLGNQGPHGDPMDRARIDLAPPALATRPQRTTYAFSA
jgi:hypothetical protein